MSATPPLVDDAARLKVLQQLRVLDTPPDEGLDSLADLARTLLGVPVALVSLVDRDRQFFKACLGLPEPWSARRQTPLSHSFCQYTIGRDDHLAIEDARTDPLVSENLAIRDLDVVAYLGIPLVTHDGQAVGSLCAIDSKPRNWSDTDVALLRTLATAVINRLELLARVKELREARDTQEKTERYFRSLIERGMGAVIVIAPTGEVLYASPTSAHILGTSVEERVGRSAFEGVHPDDAADLQEVFRGFLEGSIDTARLELRYHHPEEEWVVLEGVGANLLEDPAVGGVVFNFKDVTRERALESEVQQRRRLELVGELTAGIAHDFNNLLSVVMANADLLDTALPPGAEEARQDLEDLRAAARGGSELIRSLMAFSRRSDLASQPVDLGDTVEQVLRMLRRILPSRVRVEAVVAPDLPLALADVRAVEQVLLNLATNARDAMPEGGTLSVRLSAETLEEDGEPRGFLRLEVADSGVGMDAETLEHAFEAFFTTKASGRGTGLGLASVHLVVEQHDGRIAVDSEPGRGTTFTIHLPAAGAEAEVVESAVTGREEGPASARVLVVEDEFTLRRTVRRTLEHLGYQVLVASNGRDALDQLEAHGGEIDLVLSDQDMPEMTGTELLEALRAQGLGVPFILTTGYTRQELGDAPHIPGDWTVLPKPWSLDDLNAAVREALKTGPPAHDSG